MRKLPPTLAPTFGALAARIVGEHDGTPGKRYAVTWLGKNLEMIYKVKTAVTYVPEAWMDEVEFMTACEEFGRVI